jgi:ATP-dependent Lon protease
MMPDQTVLTDEITALSQKLDKASLPEELREKVRGMVERLGQSVSQGSYQANFDSITRYIEWICSLPWTQKSQDILDLSAARSVLDKNHYGLEQVKQRILEYLAILKLTIQKEKVSRAPILCLLGLVGTGKTTFAYSIAEALGRKFSRIPFGGLSEAMQLRGRPKSLPDAEPGQIIKSLRRATVKNPVILLDEIDRVAEETKGDIMGVLVELLDPEQNSAFLDHYVDYPFDLSEVIFITTANNTANIATAVMDRLEVIAMPSYSDEEKIKIGKDYILPKTIVACGLPVESLAVDENVWPKVVRPLGFDAGMRSLERTIDGICRKVAKEIVEGKLKKIYLDQNNIENYLPSW